MAGAEHPRDCAVLGLQGAWQWPAEKSLQGPVASRARGAFLTLALSVATVLGTRAQPASKGTWSVPRQNRRLTAIQPLPGKMASAPRITARVTFARGQGALRPFASTPGGEVGDADGKGRVVWRAQLPAKAGPPVIADVDGDGASDILVGLGDGSLCLLRAP